MEEMNMKRITMMIALMLVCVAGAVAQPKSLSVEDKETAPCIMTIETAKLVKVSVFFPALRVYNCRVIILKLICKHIYFIKQAHRTRNYLLLKKQMLLCKSNCILFETYLKRDI